MAGSADALSRPELEREEETVACSNVSFNEETDDEKNAERKKFLTMKYGQHQLRLVQKRLRVEFWIDAELMLLYNITDASETYDGELDIDELLDMEDDAEREAFIKNMLTNCPQPPDVIQDFVDRTLAKLRTL